MKFLSDVINTKEARILLDNFNLKNVSLQKFFQEFGKMPDSEIEAFILDGDNAYKLGRFGSECCERLHLYSRPRAWWVTEYVYEWHS